MPRPLFLVQESTVCEGENIHLYRAQGCMQRHPCQHQVGQGSAPFTPGFGDHDPLKSGEFEEMGKESLDLERRMHRGWRFGVLSEALQESPVPETFE